MAQQEQRLEQLKQKYRPVLNFIQQQGQIRLQNVNMQGDKLFIRGEAPSEDAKNKVWDQIKLVDPTYSDLTADISVSESRTQTAGAAIGGGQPQRAADGAAVCAAGDRHWEPPPVSLAFEHIARGRGAAEIPAISHGAWHAGARGSVLPGVVPAAISVEPLGKLARPTR